MTPEETAHIELYKRLESQCDSENIEQRNATIGACLLIGWQLLFEALNV